MDKETLVHRRVSLEAKARTVFTSFRRTLEVVVEVTQLRQHSSRPVPRSCRQPISLKLVKPFISTLNSRNYDVCVYKYL